MSDLTRYLQQQLEAHAAGRIDGHHVLIWVAITATYPTISAALTQLDLAERERFVTPRDCEIHLQGFDVPIYITTPARERSGFEQALDAAIGTQALA